MKIEFIDMKSAVFAVKGPEIEIKLSDHSQAHAFIDLRLISPSFVVGYPSGRGSVVTSETQLSSGDYLCKLTISAASVGALGGRYECDVFINGAKVATASGALPIQKKGESSTRFFTLRVV